MSFACDRCGRVTDGRWEVEGAPGVGGCCACCGDDLCAECAGEWSEGGECQACDERNGIAGK
ncbi:MAG: hypothetical protein LBK73_05145 [Treponema sp.]|jgi:hypothetical protein|nr:hypothetical protein [Treponema sp.]